jgi:hypothetical protein
MSGSCTCTVGYVDVATLCVQGLALSLPLAPACNRGSSPSKGSDCCCSCVSQLSLCLFVHCMEGHELNSFLERLLIAVQVLESEVGEKCLFCYHVRVVLSEQDEGAPPSLDYFLHAQLMSIAPLKPFYSCHKVMVCSSKGCAPICSDQHHVHV